MRSLLLICGMFVAAIPVSTAARAAPTAGNLDFAIMRNGQRIGTTTLSVERDGAQTISRLATHIAVKLAFITVYRFDQHETERWAGDRLLTLQSRTDDNGTVHTVAARRDGDVLTVEADGRVSRLNAATIPASPWNPDLVRRTTALNPKDGKLMPVSVIDHGEERITVDGHPVTAHHYSIRTSFPQDVWYDRNQRLIKVELHGSDGSTIRYQRG